MKEFFRFAACGCVLAGSLSSVFAADKSKNAEMARVAIIKYEDKTGTTNFEYMPGSLQEAITKSMHRKFEFVEVEAAKVDPVVAAVRAKNKGKITPKEAAEICRKTDTDILIYGSFTFNKADKEIEIHTDISLGSTDKFRTLPLVENRVDATIFQAADKVASDIVAEITKVALEQQQAKGNDAKDNKGKTQLDKTAKTKTWADINWNIQLTPSVVYPLLSRENASVKVNPAANIHILYRLRGNWHVGLFGSYGMIRTSSSNSPVNAELDHGAAAVTGGYFWDLSARWRATTLLGAGYYYGKFNSYTDCSSGNCNSGGFQGEKFFVKNPFFMARTGIHFLIFSFLSIGIEGEWRLYYDSPKPINTIGGALALSVIF